MGQACIENRVRFVRSCCQCARKSSRLKKYSASRSVGLELEPFADVAVGLWSFEGVGGEMRQLRETTLVSTEQ